MEYTDTDYTGWKNGLCHWIASKAIGAEVNRTLNMIVTAKSIDEIRWGATAGALTMAMRLLDE